MSKQILHHGKAHIENDGARYETITRDYFSYLKARGHSHTTINRYQCALKQFICWISEKPQEENKAIDPKAVCTFLQEHYSSSHNSQPVFKELKTARAALNKMLLMLGYSRLQPHSILGSPAIECILRQYDIFQCNVRGLKESTRLNNQRRIRRLLIALFGSGPVVFENITPEVLLEFTTDVAVTLKPSSIGQLLSTYRGFLQFLQFKGESDVSLLATVPRPPNWSLSSIPPSLSHTDMQKFWASFDISSPIGKRDYAIARCLADLGMRCHEVTSMQINHINWDRGVIQLPHSKSRKEEQMPLPSITGRAIVDYLLNGRPVTKSRSIFVYHRAPFGKGVADTTVRGAIRRAFSRAGLCWTGTHILRHTAATQMVQAGATLKEVADILRHRSLDTTMIYTKVNLLELKQVAMAWPGRQP